MKIKIVLLSHDAYLGFLPAIWERINEFTFPDNCEVTKLVVTENVNLQCIKYCQENNIPFKEYEVNYKKLNDYLTNPLYRNPVTHWTFRSLFSIAETRNFYLDLAKEENYDYLLHIDGDILPPADGLSKLLEANKEHIGGIANSDRPNKHPGYYVYPQPSNEQFESHLVYECQIIGGCFCLEKKEIFSNVPYILPDLEPLASDGIPRCLDIIKAGYKNYCHTGVICQHLI